MPRRHAGQYRDLPAVMVFGTVSPIYFALCWPLSLYAGYIERRFATGTMRKVEKPLVMSPA